MGFFDILDAFIDVTGLNDSKYKVTCQTLELFEIGTKWVGTARVHGAGEHAKTVKVDYQTTITMPYKDDDLNYTRRGLLRKQLRDWVGSNFSKSGKIAKENIVLNPSENCLSAEGFVVKCGDTWKFVDNPSDATYFGSYKLFITDAYKDTKIGHSELNELFMESTVGYVTGVDVHEGF